MVYLNVRHTVADYQKWRVGFDAHESARRAAGATGANQIYRDEDDANSLAGYSFLKKRKFSTQKYSLT